MYQDLSFKPLDDLKDARELVDALLDDHKDLLPGELATKLDTYRGDLDAAIEDGSGRLNRPAG